MADLSPLSPVSGGVVDPDDLVGREREERDLLLHVASGGAYVVGDRRMGKTSLLRLITRDLRHAGHVVVTVSAETSSLDTFNESFLQAIQRESVFAKRWKAWTKAFEGEVRLGTTNNGIRLQGTLSKPGAPPAETDVLALCSRAARDAGKAGLVVIIDEIAQLAFFLHETDPAAGGEFLRTLRRLRQSEQPDVRIVLAGSVGLHYAIDDFTVLNDLPEVRVAGLRHEDAVVLARRLMLGVCGREDPMAADRLATAVSDIPYYVQRLAAELDEDTPLESVDWTARVDAAIDSDLWGSDHYVSRLPKYYPGLDGVARAILDAVAASTSVSLSDLVRQLSTYDDGHAPDESTVSALVEKLTRDHYLSFSAGEVSFTSPLLTRIWTRTRTRLR